MRKTAPVLLCLIILLSGCDDFTRFKQEKMECQTNLFGPVDLIIKKKKVGSELRATGPALDKKLTIIAQDKNWLSAESDDISAEINFEKKRVTLRLNNKLESVYCKYHNFKM